jgi:hypothetical protein
MRARERTLLALSCRTSIDWSMDNLRRRSRAARSVTHTPPSHVTLLGPMPASPARSNKFQGQRRLSLFLRITFEIASFWDLRPRKLAIWFLRFPRNRSRGSVVASEETMRPKERRETGQSDLLRSRLDAIIDMSHPLVRLARTIDLTRSAVSAAHSTPSKAPMLTRLRALPRAPIEVPWQALRIGVAATYWTYLRRRSGSCRP